MLGKLKQCPFCGGEAAVCEAYHDGEGASCFVVLCNNCGAGSGACAEMSDAIAHWNTRAYEENGGKHEDK